MSEQRNLSVQQQEFLNLIDRSTLPLIVAPMFLVSGPELVVACAAAGIAGSYPAANARSISCLREWMRDTADGVRLAAPDAPWSMNMIVHSSYGRFQEELSLVAEFQPKVVSTALGSPKRVMDTVRGYGGIVVADVTSPKLAKKAMDAGVDVLVLVCQGAGGHTGNYHPFALVAEVRKFWRGPLGIAGAITTGRDIRIAQLLGADFAVAGTRFIATTESLAVQAYREMVVDSGLEDLVESSAVSGVMANWLKPSLEKSGVLNAPGVSSAEIDFSGDISVAPKAWKDVWSAGHGVGGIGRIQTAAEAINQLKEEYVECLRNEYAEIQRLHPRFIRTI